MLAGGMWNRKHLKWFFSLSESNHFDCDVRYLLLFLGADWLKCIFFFMEGYDSGS